jgi:hypothetical protein
MRSNVRSLTSLVNGPTSRPSEAQSCEATSGQAVNASEVSYYS